MFDSALLLEAGLVIATSLILGVFIKAAVKAWQGHIPATQSDERTWAWWVELHTARPQCTYFFGPFATAAEAEASKIGYIQDLSGEGAEGITVHVRWCKPRQLTYMPT